MKALITGATSGIGLEFAYQLSDMGYDLILVARDKNKLESIASKIKTEVEVISMDLSNIDNVKKLYIKTKERVDLLINNAGFGLFGEFINTSLEKEINMIDLNVNAYHILTKLFVSEMVKRDSGRILNVASSASFQPGPLMSTYYATKSYVYSISAALYEELRRMKSNVKINILCPGPVNTSFNERAYVKFQLPSLEPSYVVKYTIKKMFKNNLIIIPGFKIRLIIFLNRFVSRKLALKITYLIQKRKAKY